MTSPTEPEQEASFILAILYEEEINEEDRTRMIEAHHAELTTEQYLAVWELLDSKARSAWKKYLEQAYVMKVESRL